jgi:hypothetical protein
MSFIRTLLLCITFAASGVLVQAEHSRAQAQETGLASLHDDHGHDHHSHAGQADENGAFDLDAHKKQHGSSSHGEELHFVAIGVKAPDDDLISRRNAERCFSDCFNLLGPFLPRDPDPDRA